MSSTRCPGAGHVSPLLALPGQRGGRLPAVLLQPEGAWNATPILPQSLLHAHLGQTHSPGLTPSARDSREDPRLPVPPPSAPFTWKALPTHTPFLAPQGLHSEPPSQAGPPGHLILNSSSCPTPLPALFYSSRPCFLGRLPLELLPASCRLGPTSPRTLEQGSKRAKLELFHLQGAPGRLSLLV